MSGEGGKVVYTVERTHEGVTERLEDCETMDKAVQLIEEDMPRFGEGVVYHIERDDGKGIGDEIE